MKAEQVVPPSDCWSEAIAAELFISAFDSCCGTASGLISNGLRLAMPFPWLLALFYSLKRSTVNLALYGDKSVLLKPLQAASELIWPGPPREYM